jgi:hypothetical protein
MSYVSLDDYRDIEARDEAFDERPGNGSDTRRLGGVAIESGCDCICTGVLGVNCILKVRDICADWAMQLNVDAADQLWPWFGLQKTTPGAIKGNDVCPGFADGSSRFEVRRDVDIAILIVGFDDSNDREIGLRAKRDNAFDTLGPEPASSATQYGGRDSDEGIGIIQRIAFVGLTGDDQPSSERSKAVGDLWLFIHSEFEFK